MSSLLDSIFTYIRTPRQPVSDRTGAAPDTPSGGPEMATEQPMGKIGPEMGVTFTLHMFRKTNLYTILFFINFFVFGSLYTKILSVFAFTLCSGKSNPLDNIE